MIKVKSLAWIEDRERLFVVKFFDTVKGDTLLPAGWGND